MKIKLHEAIEIVLLSSDNRTVAIEEIAQTINNRGLYHRSDQKPVPAYQIKMRCTMSKGRYLHLFEWIEPNMVRLRNLEK